MKYTARIRQWGREVELTWEDGELSGDQDIVDRLTLEAELREGSDVSHTPTGPATQTNHLSDPLSTLRLLQRFIADEDILELTGDVPEAPEVPEGGIA